jgi:hypothetical protein
MPATAAGKLSRRSRLGTPWKNRHAASSPSMVAPSVCCTKGHTKQCRLQQSTTTSAQTICRFPLSGSASTPNRPKSSSAASPGAHSGSRTVVRARRPSPTASRKRRNVVYVTTTPCLASSSCTRVSCSRSARTHCAICSW